MFIWKYRLEHIIGSWEKKKKREIKAGKSAKSAIFKALIICVKENCCCCNHRHR